MLSLIPARFSVAVLFIVGCFVSVAMGTSVGTITLLTPIAVAVSTASGFDLAFCVASVMGGAMFGDNLSFISDTTIAACNGQGCEMKDKFRENFWIALPAAVVTLIFILVLSFQTEIQGHVIQPYHLTQVIPYVLVLIGGIVGINVFVVLLTGIVSGALIMLIGGYTVPVEILKNMGSGVSGMFETCMVAILVAPCVRSSVSMGDLMHFLAGYTEFSVEKRVVSLVWDFSSAQWILQRPTIQWLSLWRTQLRRRWQGNMALHRERQRRCLIHFHAFFKG